MNKNPITKVALFEDQKIRKIWHEDKWWFSVVDVCAVLTNSIDAGAYWRKLKQRLNEEGSEVVTFCHGLKLEAIDGKKYITDCANTEGILRIIQSIPSPKAEPFKLWLARVGHERIQEIEDPELATKRTRELYKAKGYPDAWIEKRMRGIEVRATLTDTWKEHGVKEAKEYEILTAEISKAAFDMTPSEYKKYKGLKRENLRDHMNDLELIFSMLGEAATTEITNVEHPLGFDANKKVSKRGGNVAKEARVKLENETGKKIVSKENYLQDRITQQKIGKHS
ncbi:MAG: Bro-N domain-containing protein [Gammaproteobacteria bacterium]|nr:Bro-N domain-containing protein [Gammaproteobacteria bacterium]